MNALDTTGVICSFSPKPFLYPKRQSHYLISFLRMSNFNERSQRYA